MTDYTMMTVNTSGTEFEEALMHSVVRIVNSSNLKKDLTVIHGNEMHSDDADIIGVIRQCM